MRRLLVLLLLVMAPVARATTWTAADCNQASVQTVHDAVTTANGDTIVIPNGSCNWSGTLVITKQITLQGQTAGSVILTDTNPTACGNNFGCNTALNSILLNITIGSSFHTTIANLNFIAPTTNCGSLCGPYIYIHGTGLTPLMHDMDMQEESTHQVQIIQWAVQGGVAWNMTVHSPDQLGTGGSWGYKPPTPSWDSASTLGNLDDGTKNLYIEDSTITGIDQFPDVDDNGRVVVRHSTLAGTAGLTHGPTSAIGGRQYEYYNDTFTYPNTGRNLNRYFWSRAGTGIFANNSYVKICCATTSPTLVFTVEDVQRQGQGGECTTGWQGWHQSGSGASNSTQSPTFIGTQTGTARPDNFQIPAPIYIFGSTGTGAGNQLLQINDGQASGCANTNPATGVQYTARDIMKLGRDIYTDDTVLGTATCGGGTCGFASGAGNAVHQIGTGLLSARPTTGFVGDAYYATDTTTLYQIQPASGKGYNYTAIVTESPISAGSNWTSAGAVTSNTWGDVQTSITQNLLFGALESPGCPTTATACTDPTAVLNGTWTSDQEAEATAVVINQLTTCCIEVELRLRTSITATGCGAGGTSPCIKGYEIDCSVSHGGYFEVVRWNGALGDFTSLGAASTDCSNGDVIKATAIGSTISIYKNGVLQKTFTDSTFTSGSPGVGFFNNFNTLFSNYGLTNFKAASLGANSATWSAYWTPFTYPHPLRASFSQAATPTFSPATGTYLASQVVTITSTTGSATICYTNDGTTPTANGAGTCTHGTTLANGGTIAVSFTQLVQAIASASGFTDSTVGSAQYTLPTATLGVMFARTR